MQEAELRRATTYLEGVQGALEEQKIKTEESEYAAMAFAAQTGATGAL